MTETVRARAELIAAVRSGKTSADLLQGGATSLTNLGKRRVALRPAAFDCQLCLRQILHVTLSADHRVMDGVPAAKFLDRIVELLEKPFLLFCDTPAAPCS
jgi:pyruvate/2-oxoglutarate dehydrogenase complex dihydrolipoamide acyltransferase (E2) component